MGIEVGRVQVLTFALGIGILAIAAALLLPGTPIQPTQGLRYTVITLLVVVLGGMTNFVGIMLGGLVIGISEAFGTIYLSDTLGSAPYVIFVLIMLFRPQGLTWSSFAMREEFYKTLSSPVWWGVLALAAVLPFILSSYYLHIVILSLVYVALASSWNIVGGMAGQISLAHSLFIGIGAMLSSALLLKLGINMWLGLLISAAVSAAVGAAIAWIDFRFRLGHLSFVLITLAFAEMGAIIVEGWDFFGGASGLLLPRDTGNWLGISVRRRTGARTGLCWRLPLSASSSMWRF